MGLFSNIHDEIDEIFNEFSDGLNYELLHGSSQSMQVGYRHGGKDTSLERTYIVPEKKLTEAWKLFKCRASEKKPERYERFIKCYEMLSSGLYSLRSISRETKYSINTVCRLMKKVIELRIKMEEKPITCPCGKPIEIHFGWCAYRFKNSPTRQESFYKILEKQSDQRRVLL